MQAISDLKEQTVTDTPLIVFDCILSNGQAERWSTHGIAAGGNAYAARVIQHSSFDIQTASSRESTAVRRSRSRWLMRIRTSRKSSARLVGRAPG